MILSTASAAPMLAPGGVLLLDGVALLMYLIAALPVPALRRIATAALFGGWVLHALLLVIDIAGFGQTGPGARLGFGPVLSMTVWLVILVYGIESRLVPLPTVRQWLAAAGLLVVLLVAAFPGEMRPLSSPLAPLHFALGVGAYGLFGAAVLHGVMLDAAERRLRDGGAMAKRGAGAMAVPGATTATAAGAGMPARPPLLQLERITFRFVEAGFVVLTATLVLGFFSTVNWRWSDHKAVFSIMAWAVFAALLLGRRLRGWRGRHATRWLYAGTALLLLGYVGSRFVLEVVLSRPVP
ncbi:MAG: cytochrome c biogenesis protein CcsA [Rubrivivax sp.]